MILWVLSTVRSLTSTRLVLSLPVIPAHGSSNQHHRDNLHASRSFLPSLSDHHAYLVRFERGRMRALVSNMYLLQANITVLRALHPPHVHVPMSLSHKWNTALM